METRRIGTLQVSVVGLGCNNFGARIDEATSTTVVHAALDAGITFFDTAELYADGKSEEFLGKALGRRRSGVIIATKFGHKRWHPDRGAHPTYVRRAVEASLRRLGTDVIDLYQLHTPDPLVPIADTLGALDELVKAGKVREIGCSQFSVEQLREAAGAVKPGAAKFVSVQNEYSLLRREPERGVLQYCEQHAMAFLPFFPLASGLLTGKYRKGKGVPEGSRIADWFDGKISREDLDHVEGLIAFAESRGHTILDLAFSWLRAHPMIASVIAGATTAEQVHANVAAAWRLTSQEMAAIDRIAPPAD
ncbi:MAG TPA: aldo/keto reductase [Gemmatimonadaceae bacterium]|nr:aldo/keto reductase [Gemmatimonadaceae bacterium]